MHDEAMRTLTVGGLLEDLDAPPIEGINELKIQHTLSDDPKWQTVERAWYELQNEPEDGVAFFDHIVIAGDGGLSEIGTKEQLWSNSRYVSSIILLVFVVYNMYFILCIDIGILNEHFSNATAMEDDYLVSKYIIDRTGFGDTIKHPMCIIAVIELLILMMNLCILLWDVFAAVVMTGHAKWKGISKVCWIDLPELSIFSAMKLLQYVVPQKLSYDLNYAFFYDAGRKSVNVGTVLLTRPLCLIIGMDCFLVKYRAASTYIMKDDGEFMDMVGGIIFLNQILGVVNLTYTIKSRLYRFVFGGEDGVMSKRELVRQEVWESFVTYNVFEKYPCFKAIAMMLSWCDDDFQMLALNDNAVKFNDRNA